MCRRQFRDVAQTYTPYLSATQSIPWKRRSHVQSIVQLMVRNFTLDKQRFIDHKIYGQRMTTNVTVGLQTFRVLFDYKSITDG